MLFTSLTIRLAGPADAERVERLAQRDSTRVPGGELLLAEVDGELVAALSLDGGESVADPFRPTAEIVRVLGMHARRMLADRRAADRVTFRGHARRALAR